MDKPKIISFEIVEKNGKEYIFLPFEAWEIVAIEDNIILKRKIEGQLAP